MRQAIETLVTLGRVFGFALEAVWAYKLRSIFVSAGIAMGIAALTVIVTSVDGAQRKALEIVDMFGPDAVFVLGGDIKSRAVGKRTLTLSWEDARRLRQSLPGAYLVVPMRAKRSIMARYGGKSKELPVVVGSTAAYSEVWNWPLAEGRDFSDRDVALGTKVGLIGDQAAEELFGDESPIGKVVFLGDLPIQVIGRLSYRGFSGGGSSIDERMIIPLTTLTQRFNMDRKYFRALRVKFHDPERMSVHVENTRSLLRHLHGLKDGEDDDFTILTADEILKFIGMLKGGLVVFLGVTATVAMLVGGFVLANLFYISVSERTSEIGLRKAMGAKAWTITAQFLFEAAILTIAGALIGMGLGLGLGQALTRLGILEIQFSAKVFVLALSSAVAVGVIFGIRPARQAARLDAVAALRGDGS
ncbi:ABC transporter permease [Desulfovibrio ferrophilus]|uniref:ABC transporter membrane protein n=1 Tax=Desulfovibrio ferrophilus TaxID=241368 RepID=A0A2Z6B0D0_9BACT|nr:ABC transporter permease [Desulfovibrio ferrophilus]BBD08890.1 ABC transporter membrane protein [Desulfovibrio ferrophilus]